MVESGSPLPPIIFGCVANGLTWAIGRFAGRSRAIEARRSELARRLEAHDGLGRVLERAVASFGRSIDGEDPSEVRKLRAFMASPDVDAVVRQVYSIRLVTDRTDLALIEQEFTSSMVLYLGDGLRKSAPSVFAALVECCDIAISAAVEDGILAAHEARSTQRHRAIIDELASIKKNVEFLAALDTTSHSAILQFEEQYRQQVAAAHSTISPPDLDAVRRIPIESIYVEPDFLLNLRDRHAKMEMSDFVPEANRAVVLGNPGGGKSTLAEKLCHDLARGHDRVLLAGRRVVPILVIVRDYGAEHKRSSCSIVEFMAAQANSKYQIKPPPGAFEYLLLNGHAAVILDGLDELLDTSYRQRITSNIEAFCHRYPAASVIVTSREVGYEQAPLDPEGFAIFHLAPFSVAQVEEYVGKWFETYTNLTADQRTRGTRAFLRESAIVPDLQSNPLMLALMCNIYRGENYIPRNRPELYEKCATMLFDRWDKRRGIRDPFPFEANIDPAMKYLAYLMYADEGLQASLTEEQLTARAADYLQERRFEDRDEAELHAREFVRFCTGRAWVFTDVGTTSAGDRLYQFTHRTFLEYFAAAHIVRTHPTPRDLTDALLSRIEKREWDVVAQLAFQIQNRNLEGAGDELTEAVLTRAKAADAEVPSNLLSFAAKCLRFLVLRPKTVRDVSRDCFRHGLSRTVHSGDSGVRRSAAEPAAIFGELGGAASENVPVLLATLETEVAGVLQSGTAYEALRAAEIAFGLVDLLRYDVGEQGPSSELLGEWDAALQRLTTLFGDRIKKLSRKHFRLCAMCADRGVVPLSTLVSEHGISALFRPFNCYLALNMFGLGIAERCLGHFLGWISRGSDPLPPEIIRQLEDIGALLAREQPPWLRHPGPAGSFSRFWFDRALWRAQGDEHVPLGRSALYAALCLLAVFVESRQKQGVGLPRWVERAKQGPVTALVQARSLPNGTQALEEALARTQLTPGQRTLLVQWGAGLVDLIQPDSRS